MQQSASEIKDTLLGGISTGLSGLSSLLFFLGFATLSTLFVLKDGPVMHRFIDRHLGVPQPVAHVVTTNVAKSLRSYFLGVSIIAGFNAVLIGIAALVDRRAARRDDRGRHLRGRVRPLRRRLGRRRALPC